MAIVKTLKAANGYERTGYDVFSEVSEGERPALAEVAQPANWLPVQAWDDYNHEGIVVLAGTIMGFDSLISGVPRLVPAVGASPMTITYGTYDVSYTVDADDLTSLVASAGAASAVIAANRPVGWAWFHYYSAGIRDRLINYDLQAQVSILLDYIIELALVDDITGVQNFAHGSFIKPGVTGTKGGLPHLWVNGADSAELICGRVIYRATIPYGTSSRSRMDLVKPVKGLSLSGVENGGRPRHLDVYQIAAPTVRATDFVRASIICC